MKLFRRKWALVAGAVALVSATAVSVPLLTQAANATAVAFSTTLVSRSSALCADVPGGATTMRSALVAAACTGGAGQAFTFTPVSGKDDTFTIGTLNAKGCVDVTGRSKADGTSIKQYTCNSRTNQQFRMVAVGSGSDAGYNLVAVHSGKCVAVGGDATAAGTALVQSPCTAQRAWLVPRSTAGTSPSPTGSTSGDTSSTAAPSSAAPSPTKVSASPSASPTSTTAAGDCPRSAGSSPVVKTTQVDLGVPVTGYGGQSDTEPLPMAIAATPSGRSWLAWLGTDGKVYLGSVDCDDHLTGTPTSFTGIDLQDVAADADGGVLLLTREGDCHTGPLCGGTSSPCNTMWMIRFDNSGHMVWEQQVTNLNSSRGGYDDGARFVWWYQHHGRLAYDGTNYSAYFSDAVTVQNGDCVDIHEGDRMQVVGPTGALLSGHDSFELGCSHSWDTHSVWDPRTGHFVMVCATDNNCRIAQAPDYRTVASGTCDGTLFGGDIVLSSDAGYWVGWSQGGKARLDHFSTGASDRTVTTSAAAAHPHLVTYGGRMLLAWASGSKMAAQVYDSGTGSTVGGQFTIDVPDHAYLSFKAYADGSAAYAAAGSTGTSIVIARVMPMS
ncbi:RICIN domain-containing protein [Streptomyces sp. NPDC047072]|uniref:RICIN domain-containing protein n=1 Tax=Streptomyces sp. NPDC047072 TaxID=3154809 RepID=UPI0033EF2368